MQIVRASEMAKLEKVAYAEGASEERFMENAGRGVAEFVQIAIGKYHLRPNILLLCGKGNNAGDAYVAGRILRKGGFPVRALSIASFEECSRLCKIKSKEFLEAGGEILFINEKHPISFDNATLLVDGIYGTGFKGDTSGIAAKLIQMANASKLPIIAVDIPSGINGETGEVSHAAISATETLFLGMPKTGCFIGEAWNYVGKMAVYDFGLDVSGVQGDFELIEEDRVKELLPQVHRTQHKYERGYVVGLGGSLGMPGAALLSSFAALKAGSGIVRLLHPAGMEAELSGAPYELIREGYTSIDEILQAMERASSVFVGPGIGLDVKDVVRQILEKVGKPLVIDAEALTLIAAHDLKIPENAILTPHVGEMRRLLHLDEKPSKTELLEKTANFAKQKRVTVVLKGAPTFIFHHDHQPLICARGDPGMATAGSGDVLTGICAALLAQLKDPLHAAMASVYIHALAGEKAAQKYTSYSMTASNITEMLPEVFGQLHTR